MSRRISIAVLACALATFATVSVLSIKLWVEQRHVPALGWVLLASDALVLWIGLGYVRFRLREAREEERNADSVAGAGHLADMRGAGAAAATHDLGSGATPVRS